MLRFIVGLIMGVIIGAVLITMIFNDVKDELRSRLAEAEGLLAKTLRQRDLWRGHTKALLSRKAGTTQRRKRS